MEKLLTCRKCHKVFTAKTEEEGITWYSRSRGYNYHMECWKELTDNSKTKTEDEWIDLIFDLIMREIQGNYAFFRIKAQIDGFIKNGMTAKGIYFACYYFFIVKKQAYKEEYGIGIVPHVYEDSCNYWIEEERKKQGIMQEIVRLQKIEAGEARKIASKKPRKHKVIAEPKIEDLF